ncbi:MAG: RagB/SusD family nutrient uptake outer membrane protein [Bacteroidia bacterium]
MEDTTGVIYTQIPLAHLTELMLIRAESAGELGQNLEQAKADLDSVMTRAGIPLLANGASAATIIATARAERHKELVIEGNRLHELKRQAVRGNNSLLIRGAPWDCNGLVCQFPDNELAGNLNMVKNPEGGCN